MKSDRPPTQPVSFNDSQFVEVVGASVHSPVERAKPRPAGRPREAKLQHEVTDRRIRQVSEKKFQQFDEAGEAANEY